MIARTFVALLVTLCVTASSTIAAPSSSPIRLQLRAFALNLDPATMADTESRKVGTLLYTGLVAVDQNGVIHPRIARAWRQIDATRWKFELDPESSFPDGTRITASKVMKSLCASMQPSHVQSWSLSSIARREIDGGKSVECVGLNAIDDSTLSVEEQEATPWVFEALAGPGGWIVDTDAPKNTAYGIRPGSGPYVVGRVEADRRILLSKREKGAAVGPKSDAIIFEYVPDPAVAARMFETGLLDLVEIDSPQMAELLLTRDESLKSAGGKVSRFRPDRARVAAFNLRRLETRGFTPEQIRAFLQDYATAVPRERIADRARGLAAPMWSGFAPFEGRNALAVDRAQPATD